MTIGIYFVEYYYILILNTTYYNVTSIKLMINPQAVSIRVFFMSKFPSFQVLELVDS